MGKFTYNIKDIRKDVKNRFKKTQYYLVAFKNNGALENIKNLLISNLYASIKENKTFIIYFSKKGIYEKEISSSLKGKYKEMKWDDIGDIRLRKEKKKAILEIEYKDTKINYEIDYKGRIVRDNKENLENIENLMRDFSWFISASYPFIKL